MKKLFGTDGIRGTAGEFPLDEKTVRIIGASLARLCRGGLGRTPKLVTGRDTRESGESIEKAFHAGATAEGAECFSAGVITTPGVAYITKAEDLDAGIVISASHNPFEDNGLKIFNPSGKKARESTERAVEADIYAGYEPEIAADTGPIDSRSGEFQELYLEHLVAEFSDLDLSGKKIVIDCANGAASHLAPTLFEKLGGHVFAINNSPDGRNINKDCGSLHLEHLRAKVRDVGGDIGVAFDGDADRSLFVDENGSIIDGDAVLWVMAKCFQDHGKLASGKVIATVMSNIGLELALKSRGIELVRTAVGDKYVLDELLASGAEIGGEQSGHIIFPEKSLVGDGMLTALNVLKASAELGGPLSAAADGFNRYPQVLVNVKVREKKPFGDVPAIASASSAAERKLDGTGRLLLRYSGTENLARVMIEGQDQSEIETMANGLADVIGRELG